MDAWVPQVGIQASALSLSLPFPSLGTRFVGRLLDWDET